MWPMWPADMMTAWHYLLGRNCPVSIPSPRGVGALVVGQYSVGRADVESGHVRFGSGVRSGLVPGTRAQGQFPSLAVDSRSVGHADGNVSLYLKPGSEAPLVSPSEDGDRRARGLADE